jgi:UDP-2,4-diacetamido-2,4,6-trideoxy-beta-L-altropyranose hydrolase
MKNLLIRADASGQAGMGHVMRCLALAQVWRSRGGKAVFLGHCSGEGLKNRISSDGFEFFPLAEHHPDPDDLQKTMDLLQTLAAGTAKRDTWLIVDGYHFDALYQRRIKEAGYSLLMLDDYGQAGHCCADIILNQNMLADRSFYPDCAAHTLLLLGTSYTLIREEFPLWRPAPRIFSDVAHKILVTMGGGDSNNLTFKVLQSLRKLTLANLEVKVVIGHLNYHDQASLKINEISEYCPQILFSVKEMPELMAWCDMAIIQAGGTLWELLFMGCAVMSYATTAFQENILRTLDKMHVAKYLGYANQMDSEGLFSLVRELALNKRCREEICGLATSIVDGRGAERVLGQMQRRDSFIGE